MNVSTLQIGMGRYPLTFSWSQNAAASTVTSNAPTVHCHTKKRSTNTAPSSHPAFVVESRLHLEQLELIVITYYYSKVKLQESIRNYSAHGTKALPSRRGRLGAGHSGRRPY